MGMAWRGENKMITRLLARPGDRDLDRRRRWSAAKVPGETGGGRNFRTGIGGGGGGGGRRPRPFFSTAEKKKFQEETKQSTKPNPTTSLPFQKRKNDEAAIPPQTKNGCRER